MEELLPDLVAPWASGTAGFSVATFLKGDRAAVGLGGAARGAKGRGGHICAAWEGFDWMTTFHSHTVIYNEEKQHKKTTTAEKNPAVVVVCSSSHTFDP